MPDNEMQASLDSFLAKESEFKATTLRNNWANSAGTSPDDFAKQIALSRATGIPAQSLAADPEEAQRHAALQGTDFTGLVTTAPKTANFLLDQKNAGLYRDKTAELSAIEKLMAGASYLGGSALAGLVSVPGAAAKIVESVGSNVLGVVTSDTDAAAAYHDDPEGLKRAQKSPAMILSRVQKLILAAEKEAMARVSPAGKARYDALEYDTLEEDKSAWRSGVKIASDALRSLPSSAALALTYVFTKGAATKGEAAAIAAGVGAKAEAAALATGVTAAVAKQVGQKAVQKAGVAAATDMAVKFGATSEGVLGYAQQAMHTQQDIEGVSLDKLKKSPEFQKLLDQGYDENVARIFTAARAGEQAGVGAGFVDAITNAIGGKFLGKLIGEGGALLPRIAKGGLNEALTETVQSGGEQLFENIAKQANANPDQDLTENILKSMLQGLAVGGFTGGSFSGILGRAAHDDAVEEDAQHLTDLFAAAAQVHDRDPETFKQFFQTIAPDATVLIDPDKLQEVLLQVGIDPAKLPSFIEQANTSQAGAGIEIPVHELIAAFTGTGAEAALIPHVRFGADMPTLAESREAGTKAAEFFQKEADRILEEQSRNEEFVAGAKAVQDDIKAQLDSLGRFGPQATSGYAALTGAFYTTMASQLGVTPLQLRDGWTDAQGVAHRGYKLSIGGTQNPATAQSLNQLEPATRDTFTGAGIPNLLKTDNWTILTAENPNAKQLSDEENLARNAELQQYLTAQGYEFTPVKGHYGHPENSFVVTGISPEQAQALAKQFEQESVLTRHGLVYQDGSITPSNGLTVHPSQPEDFYTTLPDGTHFTVGLDFEGPRQQLSDVLNQVSPEQARQTNVPVELPTSQEFADAVAGTPGAQITKDGLLIDLVRYQKQEQEGAQAIRTGVFYLPTGAATAKHYKKKGTMASGNEYGGAEEFKGETLVRRPLFVKGATGGKAPEVAYDTLKGKKAYDAMRTDVLHAVVGWGVVEAQKIENVEEMLTRYGAEPGLAAEIVRNSRKGNLLPYAVQENIVAHAVRAAGYDAVVGYSKGKAGLNISEVFDVREQTFPARGMESDIHDAYLNQTARDFQTVTPAQIDAIRKEVAWTETGTENGFPVWKNAQVALTSPVDVTEGHDVFYKPLGNERAVKYEIQDANGRSVGYTVLELADGWPTLLLDIEVAETERGKRYAEQTVAAIANDAGELGIWHIVPSARSWWERIGAAPVDEHNGTIDFNGYADARASRENAQGLGGVEFNQSQSSRRPTTKRAPEDHLGEAPLTVDYSKIEPDKNVQNMALVSKYPGLRFKARDAAKRVEEFIQHVTSNLLWLHDQIPAEIRQRSKLWYDGARQITDRWAVKYDKSDAQIAAVLAVYSPQKDWFMNVSLAERTLDIVKDQQNFAWDDKMSAVADVILAKEQYALLRSAIEGKTLGQLTDKLEQAAWIRTYDEANDNRGHRIVTPEGGFSGYATTVKGVETKTGWGSFPTIIKALYILEDGSAKTIDAALGGEHKVRSFYNNIFHPNSDLGFVTIDTHAVAAGLLRPLSGNDTEVSHNFGSGGVAQSATTGMSGTYPYYQEAYRRAAEARGLLPREMQSITWEAVRELYTMGFKHDKVKLAALDTLWSEYEKGKRSLDDVRAQVLKLAGGIERPAWIGRDPGLSEKGWASTYTSELLGRSAPGRDGAATRGAGSRAAGAVQDVLNQTNASKPGAVAGGVVGVHFSREKRGMLSSGAFGTGLTGAERERLQSSNDDRIKQRIAFYVSNGKGVFPEAGVGGAAHVATLTNLYDADADALKLFRSNQRDPNAAESAVLDAGFDGYLRRDSFTNQGTVVMLGARSVSAPHVGGLAEANAQTAVPPPAEIPALKAAAIALANDKTLPGGALTPAKWKEKLEARDPQLAASIDFGMFKADEPIYKDQLSGALWQQAASLDLFAAKNGDKLGSFNPNTLDLRLLADANLSTFLHETGHFFLTVYADLASQPDAPEAITKGMAEILKQFGVADVAAWQAMPLELQRPYHEQFAESFEQYLFTGKAPSLELQPLFQRFASWLTRVYVSIKDFIAGHEGAKLNPELAAVFDRMLATENEIAAANAARGFVALFKDATEAGMSDKDFAAYTALSGDQKTDAEEMLRTRGLRDMKWLENRRNKVIAELQADAKERRDAVLKEVSEEVAATPLRKAMRWLKHGKMTGADGVEIQAPGGNKLQISELEEMFPEGALVAPPDWKKLGYGQYGMLAAEGLSPDLVAEMFGITSGQELVSQLLGATKFADEVNALTDQHMLEQYGDLSSPDAISRAADEAIHNDARTRMVATELSALAKNVGAPSVLMKAAREYARQIVETKSSKTLKPWSFAAAETRAGKAALEALRKGDREKAAGEKRTELVNHVAAKEAYAAEKEIRKIVDRLKAIVAYKDDSSSVKTRDADIVNAVRAILADFGIGTKGKTAREYLAVVQANNPDLAAVLSDTIDAVTAEAKAWQELPLSKLRGLSEEINGLWFLAKRSKQVEIDGKLIPMREAQDAIHERLVEIGIPDHVPGEGSAVTAAEKRGILFDRFVGALRRVESWAGAKDGALTGPFRKFMWNPVRDAANAYRADKVKYLKAYRDLLKPIAPTLTRQTIDAPELGYVFGKDESGMGKAELLHAILHTGNESNKRKLLLGRGWATELMDKSLDTSKWDAFIERMENEGKITKADYDFAQGVWDLMEGMKPLAQKAHRDVFGRYFSEVSADTLKTRFGDYRGGYVPALTDPLIVRDADLRALAETENSNMAFAFPATTKGFTKSRVESYAKPLKLDLRALSQHIDKVLLFSHMTRPVNDVRRMMSGKAVAQALGRVDPQAYNTLIIPWLNRAAKQVVETQTPGREGLGRFWSVVRGRAGMAAMFGNLANAAQQVTGLSLAAVRVRPALLLDAMTKYALSPSALAEQITGKSSYMATRLENEVSMMSDQVNDILLNPTIYENAKNWTNRHAYFLQSAVDSVISPVVWLGGYNQAIEAGMSEADAIRAGDSAVRETQGSTAPEDIASFESGTAFYRMFVQFAGYFNMNANLLGTEYVKLTRDIGLRAGVGRGLYLLVLGFLAPAIVGELIMQIFKGGPEDDDKDGEYLDDWLMTLFAYAPARYLTAMVPGFGQVINAAANTLNNKPYDDRISTAPAISMVESAVKAPLSVYKAIAEDGKPSRAIKDVATLISMAVGVPASAAARPISYLSDVAGDRVAPTGPVDLVRGTITGVATPESKQ